MIKRRKMVGVLVLLLILLSLFAFNSQAVGQKIRIAVMPFKLHNIHQWWTWDWDVGGGIADMLVTDLVNTGKFSVVERERLEEILQEQQLGVEGITSAATAAKVGRVLGVQLFVFGSVTEFNITKKEVSLPIVGKVVEARARCYLDARLVNVETSEIMAVMKGKAGKSEQGVEFGTMWGDLQGLTFDSGNFRAHLLGKATEESVQKLVAQIVEKSTGLKPTFVPEVAVSEAPAPGAAVTPAVPETALPSEGLVAYVKDKSVTIVTINMGKNRGVAPGNIFGLYKITNEIKDPATGKVIKKEREKVGEIVIYEVGELSATGIVTQLAEGERIRIRNEAILKK
ncbi:MAG: CsgG/HfaB family protein [Candidatus Aerophobetes bacterium]|nr:CsgG/HfaB family protein [Candidatus Aerophobetes bacterium]